MAIKDFASNRHEPPASDRIRKSWSHLQLVLIASAMLLTSFKAIEVLLPDINSRLF